MPSTIMNSGTLGDSFIKGITAKLLEVSDQAGKAYSLATPAALGVEANEMTAIWTQEKTDAARETIEGVTGVNQLQKTNQGSDYANDTFSSTYKTELNPVKFTQSITFTEEAIEDQIIAPGLNRARKLLIAGRQTMNQHAFDVFNFAFTAQASLPDHLSFYGDGKPLASTIHPIKDSTTSNTTQSNASATGITLTESNLSVARQALRRQTDDRDQPQGIGSGRTVLIVPDSLEEQAVRLTKSKLRPSTANNDLNVYDGAQITVMASKWLNSQNSGSDTAWFLVDTLNSPLIFLTRIALQLLKPYVTDSNQNLTFPVKARWVVGNKDFRGIWASKGDISAYAL